MPLYQWLAVAVLPIVAACLSVSCSFLSHRSPLEQGMEALVKAYSKTRLIEPRMCGGFHAAKYNPEVGTALVDQTSLTKAQDLILGDIGNRTDPAALLERGRLNLAMGQCKDALPLLRRAAKLMPSSADAQNDFGACLYQLERYEDALDEFQRALAVNSTLKESLFNEALCYQKLLLNDTSSAAFEKVLHTTDADWAGEAQQRHKMVSQPLAPSKATVDPRAEFDAGIRNRDADQVKQAIDAGFDMTWGRALFTCSADYLNGSVQGDASKASEALAQMELAATMFVDAKGDKGIADEVAYLKRLPSSQSASELELMTALRSTMNYEFGHPTSASGPRCDAFRKSFADRGNELLAFYASYADGICRLYSGDFRSSVGLLSELETVANRHQWRLLENGIQGNLGLGYLRQGFDSLGIEYCNKALADSKSTMTAAKNYQFIATAYWHLGDLDTALANLRRSTTILFEVNPDYSELAYNRLVAADIYRLRGQHRLSILCAQDAVKFANKISDPNIAVKRQAQSFSFLSVEEAGQLDFHTAQDDLDRALALVTAADSRAKGYPEALVYSRAASIALMQKDFARAADYYSKVEQLTNSPQGDRSIRISALAAGAKAYVSLGEEDRARSDLEKAISLIEDYRSGITDNAERVHFLDAVHGTFDQMIELDSMRTPELNRAAFDMSERDRGRTLLDQINYQTNEQSKLPGVGRGSIADGTAMGDASPADFETVTSTLPERLILLEYAVTDQGTFIFVVRRSGLNVVKSPVTTETLDHLVGDYIEQLNEGSSAGELAEQEKLLYQLLIGPVESFLKETPNVCIVPDKALHFLPFAPLMDQEGNYLVAKCALTYSPSASVLVRCLTEAKVKARQAGSKALVVGDPSFDRDRFPRLKTLSGARAEATTIRSFYPGSTLLLGGDATEAAVRSELKSCQLFHFAGHCVIDERSPWQAALLLAKPNTNSGGTKSMSPEVASVDKDGLLYLQDAYQLDVSHLRLAVLSACESGLGRFYRGEGIVSLVRPFIAARVPTVVATLWAVESESTAEFMETFHHLRSTGGISIGEALRQTQLKMVEQNPDRSPYYWAAFIVEGSDAN